MRVCSDCIVTQVGQCKMVCQYNSMIAGKCSVAEKGKQTSLLALRCYLYAGHSSKMVSSACLLSTCCDEDILHYHLADDQKIEQA